MINKETNFNLNQLKIFHTAAKLQSFTRAAEALCLTQPGVSKHIKDLEEYYGLSLFDRLGKKVILSFYIAYLRDKYISRLMETFFQFLVYNP
ncbi:MAG: LysR family transcriptional regulator [Syntrophales bacterium]|nr:LysR family transcriptional regulator [Syntrophales bacterium]MDD5533777.1 LysR family transcriptional regulator [Syntrophales bacterium]